jgi:hypothetical protein
MKNVYHDIIKGAKRRITRNIILYNSNYKILKPITTTDTSIICEHCMKN